MIYRRPNRKIPEINASSTADIAFLLLIFFLLTTSMDTDSGLLRRLPPPGRPEEAMKLQERNVLLIDIEEDDRVKCAGDYVDLPELRARAKLFIANPQDDPGLPERVPVEVPLL